MTREAIVADPVQRRILTVLVLGQLLAGAGLAAGVTVGALLAEDLLGGPGLSGLPSALFTGADPIVYLFITIVFLSGQALEGSVVTPYLVGDRIGMHPVMVIFLVLAGG